MIKELFRRVMFLVSVPKCVYCGEIIDYSDRCFCPECRKKYDEWNGRNCSRCSRNLKECSCSNKLLINNGIRKLAKVYRYRRLDEADTPNNRIIYALKEHNRLDVFEFLADEITESIINSYKTEPERFVVTNVPRRWAAISKFGYDHSSELAKRIAKNLGLRYVSCLRSTAKKSQKEVNRFFRRANATVLPKRGKRIDLSRKTVIIVDDVVTTGASMVACAKALRSLGAAHTVGATIGIAFPDLDEKRIKK